MRIIVAGAIVATLSLSGCASIVTGHNQSVSVTAKSEAQDVVGARCSLTNDKGQWFATTPGSVTVRRSYGSMAVDCKTDEMAGVSQVKSTTKGMVAGNLLFGGLIGIGVDIGTGAAYDYPEVINISMMRSGLAPAPVAPQAQVAVPPPMVVPVVAVAHPVGNVPPPAPEPVIATKPPTSPPPVATPAAIAKKAVVAAAVGQEEHQVRQLARGMQCNQSPVPLMIAKAPAMEAYTVACENGDAIAVRCEFGSCRALK
jgi:hypothetical protein